MGRKQSIVKFFVTGLVDMPKGYQLRFRVLSPKCVSTVYSKEGEKRQIGYKTEQEVTYEASENEKDGGVFSNTKLEREMVFPKRKAVSMSGDLYRMNLKFDEDHLFYLKSVAQIISNSGGKTLVRLPEKGSREFERIFCEKVEVSYRSTRLEKRLQEI